MKIKTTLLAACAAVLLALPASAALQLTITFSPVFLSSGGDPIGFGNSTWTLQYNSSQTNYSDLAGFAAVVSDSATLTVTGATDDDYNGTFAIVETVTTNFASLPNAGGTGYIGIDTGGASADFDFGTPAVNVLSIAPQGAAVSSPSIGDLSCRSTSKA